MATGDIKTFDYVYAGLTLKIDAIDNGDGTVKFVVTCVSGSADINALYWSDGVADGNNFDLGTKKDNSLNMNGSGEDWDGGLKLSSTGIGPQGLDKPTYLQTGETYVVENASLNWDTLDTLGVRATSTSTAGGSIKGVDGDAVVTECPHVHINDVTVTEGVDANAVFTVTIEEAYLYDVVVTYTTANGTAGSSDYTTTSGTVTILAGQLSASTTISVPIIDDNNPETTETFVVNLTHAEAVLPGNNLNVTDCIEDNQGVGTILDTDVTPDPEPEPTDVSIGGLSKGYWAQHTELWDGQHGLDAGDSFEAAFGVDTTWSQPPGGPAGDLADLTLLQALTVGGGDEINLARQATAALVNVANTEDLSHAYRFTEAEIKTAVKLAFGIGDANPLNDNVYNAQMGADLAHVLEFWNHADDDEGTADTHVGVDDVKTLLLANLPSPNVNTDADALVGVTGSGTMFTASLLGVLQELYPTHGW